MLSALYLPLGVVSVYWSDGDIQTKFIPINTIAFDPYASDINDVEYICYKFAKSRNDVKAKFKSGFYKSDDEYAVLKAGRRILIKEIYEKNWDKGGWDLLRVIPSCAVTGEAAGVAAAMQAKSGARPEIGALQQKLREKGVLLLPELFAKREK